MPTPNVRGVPPAVVLGLARSAPWVAQKLEPSEQWSDWTVGEVVDSLQVASEGVFGRGVVRVLISGISGEASSWMALNNPTLALLQRVNELQGQLAAVERRAAESDIPRISQATLHELSGDWSLERPLTATIEAYDDHVVARVADLSVFGEGESELEAIDDLRTNVVELAEELREAEPGSELAARWSRLVRTAQHAAAR